MGEDRKISRTEYRGEKQRRHREDKVRERNRLKNRLRYGAKSREGGILGGWGPALGGGLIAIGWLLLFSLLGYIQSIL